jgi:hypothetical protein
MVTGQVVLEDRMVLAAEQVDTDFILFVVLIVVQALEFIILIKIYMHLQEVQELEVLSVSFGQDLLDDSLQLMLVLNSPS